MKEQENTQQTFENRWLDFANTLGDDAKRMPMDTIRIAFYVGAASAMQMITRGEREQLERDLDSFVEIEQGDIDAEDKAKNRYAKE